MSDFSSSIWGSGNLGNFTKILSISRVLMEKCTFKVGIDIPKEQTSTHCCKSVTNGIIFKFKQIGNC
jgi:hypothetical protein